MWRILLTFCLITLLSACSVSIDPETEEKLPFDQSSQNGATIISDSAPKIEEEISRTQRIKEIISDVFHLDWMDLKDEYAQDIFYLALGDSLTRGVGDEKQDYGYTVRLQKQLEQWSMIKSVELDNRGKNGRRSNQLLTLLEKGHYDEELAKANLVTITLGGNDVMKIVKNNLFSMEKSMFDKELPLFIKRYDKIVTEIRLRNADVPIILIGFYNPMSIVVDEITPFESIISEWNTEIKKLSLTNNNVCFVPVDDLFLSNEDMVYHVDFFHPNSTGYDRMADRLIETMQTCDIESMSNGLIGFGE